jgi:hypothetical protein
VDKFLSFHGDLKIDQRTGKGTLTVEIDLQQLIEILRENNLTNTSELEDMWSLPTLRGREWRREWYKDNWGLTGRAAGVLAANRIFPADALNMTELSLSKLEGCGDATRAQILEAIRLQSSKTDS